MRNPETTRSRPLGLLALLALVAIAGMVIVASSSNARQIDPPQRLPEFTHTSPDAWINSPPLSVADLRGKVVLIDFWTFDCWNCYRSFPWLHELEAEYGPRGLVVVGVHTPEFKHERVRANVVAKVGEFGLGHPVMMDNDFSYWSALANRYWPAFYLVDRSGRLRSLHVGETHSGDRRARKIAAEIEELLQETGT